jgi:hypothetical protein
MPLPTSTQKAMRAEHVRNKEIQRRHFLGIAFAQLVRQAAIFDNRGYAVLTERG